jgi:hypothetical protein
MTDDEDIPWGDDNDGPPSLAMGLMNIGMCKDCAIRFAAAIDADAMVSEPCSDKCADALDRWAHPFSSFGSSRTPRRGYAVPNNNWLARVLGLGKRR